VELLSILILVEMLQGLYNCQPLSTGHTEVLLGLGQSFVEVAHNPYLGQYSTITHFTGVGFDNELLPWSREA
jgi:hypothetical protein